MSDRLTPEERAQIERQVMPPDQSAAGRWRCGYCRGYWDTPVAEWHSAGCYYVLLTRLLASEAELRSEVERLQEALAKYGKHDGECLWLARCTCGLEAALSGAPQRKDGT
jgi:hypothetical protein